MKRLQERKEIRFHVVDVPMPDPLIEFSAAYELAADARRDNIWVTFYREDNTMVYRVNKARYFTYAGAFQHVKFLQSQLAPSTEVRS